MRCRLGVYLHVFHNSTVNQCIQDSLNARFSTCALAYIAALPALTAFLYFIYRITSLLPVRRPVWTKPFIIETSDAIDDLESPCKQKRSSSILALLIVTVIGLFLETLACLYPSFRPQSLYIISPWVRLNPPYWQQLVNMVRWC